jgi:hypothetical protein
MTDTTWRDAYDNPEGMACALEEIEKWLIARSYHPDASTVDAAAACIRDLAERIAELEDQPTPAPRLPWTSIGVWSMEQGRDAPCPCCGCAEKTSLRS